MSKRQKLSFYSIEDLPNEILLKIISLLDFKEVLRCGQSSKRLREISNDNSFWLKLNLTGRKVPYGFIERAMQNGCEYLNLCGSFVYGAELEKSMVPWKLKYLVVSQSQYPFLPKVELQNCHFLEKLAVGDLRLGSREIEQICQNGETLRILSLGECYQNELIQKLFTKCHQLTEVSVGFTHVCTLVKNLTPNILKLNLSNQHWGVTDERVNILVQRCNKITELNLSGNQAITNDSVKSIVKHLNFLEKLDVSYTYIDFIALLQLASIPTLKTLHCFEEETEKIEIENLKRQLPHISINQPEDSLHIAKPTKKVNGSVDHDWFWEIRANQLDLFHR